MDLELNIKNDDEITLPNWLAETNLTLAEIGTVVLLASAQSLGELPTNRDSDEIGLAMKSLKEKGVLQLEMKGSTLSMTFDLDAARTPDANDLKLSDDSCVARLLPKQET